MIERKKDRRTFLEKMFDGNYDPDDNIKLPQPQYRKITKKAAEEHKFFEQFIPEEYLERYNDLAYCFMEEIYLENYAFYKEGLRVGLEIRKELKED